MFFTLAIAPAGVHAQEREKAAPTAATTQPEVKTAGQAFKNIQVLKDIPADELLPAMGFITSSLGVQCNYCHVPREFEKDDKDKKKTAREMMKMMMAINQTDFEGRRKVTCYSCHHGMAEPTAIPLIGAPRPPTMREAADRLAASGAKVTVDQVLAKYVEALGGTDAYKKLTSRVSKGTLERSDGIREQLEDFAKAPNKKLTVFHTPNGEAQRAFNGTVAWNQAFGRPTRQISGADLERIQQTADFYRDIEPRMGYRRVALIGLAKVADRDAYVVRGFTAGAPPQNLYFDVENGLLLRRVAYEESPLGLNPIQTDYEDYRETDGIRVPFRIAVSMPNSGYTVLLDQVQMNLPIDDAKFDPPAAKEPAASGKP